jgi:hypothetical protein
VGAVIQSWIYVNWAIFLLLSERKRKNVMKVLMDQGVAIGDTSIKLNILNPGTL